MGTKSRIRRMSKRLWGMGSNAKTKSYFQRVKKLADHWKTCIRGLCRNVKKYYFVEINSISSIPDTNTSHYLLNGLFIRCK